MLNKYLRVKLYRLLIICSTFICLICGNELSAQTIVFFESFGNTLPGACDRGTLANGYSTSNGIWNVTTFGVNDSAANEWYISAAEPGLAAGSCSVPGCYLNASYTDRTLHIGNVINSPGAISGSICPQGDCGAIYDPGGALPQNSVQTDKRVESPAFSLPANSTNVLSFNYIELGDGPDSTSDIVLLDFWDGSTWLPSLAIPPRSSFSCGAGSLQWEKYAIALPPVSVPTSVKFGFRWKNNNGGYGSSPSFAADSILVLSLINPVSDILTPDTTVCVNDSMDFRSATSGVGDTYDWIFIGASVPSSNSQNPSGIFFPFVGTYTVYLTVSNLSGSMTDSVNINVVPCMKPNADFFASDTIFCSDSCVTFFDQSTNGATAWSWFFPGGVPSTDSSPNPPIICYSDTGYHDVTLIVSNSYGSDTLVKTAYLYTTSCLLPVADFTSVVVQNCPQHCVSFNDMSFADTIVSYNWYFPGGTPDTSSISNPTICYTQEGLYDVQLIVENTVGFDTIVKFSEVNVQFVNNAFASPDTEMFFGSSYQLNAGGGISYTWTPSAGLDSINISNPIASPKQTTTYSVSITDAAGCSSVRQVTVTILHDDNLFVPNMFSPNGDGKNDYLYVRGNNVYGMRLTVFDRWGEKVFETTDLLTGWDGTFKGKELDPGVYTYVVLVNYTDKESTTRSGTVTLIR